MEGDLWKNGSETRSDYISIHSLRMEGDHIDSKEDAESILISIHSLRMEGDHMTEDFMEYALKFQSTPSAWRETVRSRCCRSEI